MPSPFPGMDPYLERPSVWTGMHFWIIAGVASQVGRQLPERYTVSVEERVYVASAVDPETASGRRIAVPDLTVVERSQKETPLGRGTATLSRPTRVQVPMPETHRERFLEIRDLQCGEQVVAVVEVLSPANKEPGEGRREYQRKRDMVLGSESHLVEIDLLRMHGHLPLAKGPASYPYGVLVSRSDTRPDSDLYPFGIRDALPIFPVPLRQEEYVDVDLGEALSYAFDTGLFSRRIDYSQPPEPPLSPEDEAWADALLREKGLRS